MSIDIERARQQLYAWTEGDALRKHGEAVGIVMAAAASRYGEPAQAEKWQIAGLLHDADYEKWPDEHPARIVAWLSSNGESELAHAVSAHHTQWGVSYETPLDKALLACDELTGFIVACSLVRPDGVVTLGAKSVLKKLKDKRFAASVDRHEVRAGAELLGVDLVDHIEFVIQALRPHAAQLGIRGRPKP